jgi:hypothetical protein
MLLLRTEKPSMRVREILSHASVEERHLLAFQ